MEDDTCAPVAIIDVFIKDEYDIKDDGISYDTAVEPHVNTVDPEYDSDEKGYTNATDQQDYIEILKESSKPYICDECGNSFTQKANLVSHARLHTGGKPFACDECGKSFAQKANLMSHARTHTGEKPFHCEVCGKSFSLRGNLVTHTRTHTGYKPFQCEICERSFTQHSSLKRHHIMTHSGNRQAKIYDKPLRLKRTIQRRTHSKQRHFQCEICNKVFTQLCGLKRHFKKHAKRIWYEAYFRSKDITTVLSDK